MAALVGALQKLQTSDEWESSKESASTLLENAEAAQATKQTERVVDYCTQVSLPDGPLSLSLRDHISLETRTLAVTSRFSL